MCHTQMRSTSWDGRDKSRSSFLYTSYIVWRILLIPRCDLFRGGRAPEAYRLATSREKGYGLDATFLTPERPDLAGPPPSPIKVLGRRFGHRAP